MSTGDEGEAAPEGRPTVASGVQPAALLVIGAVVLGYALLSHYSTSDAGGKTLGAALSIGPIFLIAAVLCWRWASPWAALAFTAAVGGLLIRYWAPIENHYQWADLAQQCGAYLLVGMSFARTLFGGRVPLCTRLAMEMHGELASVELRYLRRVTKLWAVFYLALAAVIAALFFMLPLHTWSFFVNFVSFGLIALLCVADYLVRRYTLPRRPESGLSILQRILLG